MSWNPQAEGWALCGGARAVARKFDFGLVGAFCEGVTKLDVTPPKRVESSYWNSHLLW